MLKLPMKSAGKETKLEYFLYLCYIYLFNNIICLTPQCTNVSGQDPLSKISSYIKTDMQKQP